MDMLRPGGTPSLPMALRLQGPATNVSPNITGHITRNTTRNTTAPDRGHDRKLRSGLIRKFGSRRSVSIAPRRRSRSEGGAGRGTDWSRRGMPIGERRRGSGAPPPRAGYSHAHMYGNGARADVREGSKNGANDPHRKWSVRCSNRDSVDLCGRRGPCPLSHILIDNNTRE
jgi:hypothetical protein